MKSLLSKLILIQRLQLLQKVFILPIVILNFIVINSYPDNIHFSDSMGKYNVCGEWGHCYPHCPDITVQFSKIGYETQNVTNPDQSDIYLKKE